MLDISANGAFVTLNGKTYTEFAPDGTPFDADTIQVTSSELTLNGQLVVWRQPVAYTVSLNAVSGSELDEACQKLLDAAHVRPGNATQATDMTVTLTLGVPNISRTGAQSGSRTWKYTSGRIQSGPGGASIDSSNKLTSRQYTFIFENCDHSANGVKIEE